MLMKPYPEDFEVLFLVSPTPRPTPSAIARMRTIASPAMIRVLRCRCATLILDYFRSLRAYLIRIVRLFQGLVV